MFCSKKRNKSSVCNQITKHNLRNAFSLHGNDRARLWAILCQMVPLPLPPFHCISQVDVTRHQFISISMNYIPSLCSTKCFTKEYYTLFRLMLVSTHPKSIINALVCFECFLADDNGKYVQWIIILAFRCDRAFPLFREPFFCQSWSITVDSR